MPLEPAKYAALAAEGRLPGAAQVAIKNLIRVSLRVSDKTPHSPTEVFVGKSHHCNLRQKSAG